MLVCCSCEGTSNARTNDDLLSILSEDPPGEMVTLVVGKTDPITLLFAEIYPGTVTEPVGGRGPKATGLEASRSRGTCCCDTMDKIVWEGRPNSAILQQVCLSMPEHDKLVQLDGEMFFPLRNYNFLNLSFYLRTI